MQGRQEAAGGPDSGVPLPSIQATDVSVVVPDAYLLFNAEFTRLGDDLLLTGPDGTTLLIQGYFALEAPPMLLSPTGAMMPPDLVAKLVGPLAPGQYAQLEIAQAEAPIGQVETLTGTAQATRADGVVIQLNVGDPVFQGDVVRTGPNSKLNVSFKDETVFSLSANARMVLDDFVYDPDGSSNSLLFKLIQGTFVFITGQVAPTGSMRVETPLATLGIRGTTVHVAIGIEDGAMTVSISDGFVDFFDPLTGAQIFQTSDTGLVFTFRQPGLPPVETPKLLEIQQEEERRANEVRDIQRSVQERAQEEEPEPEPSEEQEGELEGEQAAEAALETAAGPEALSSGGDYEAINTESVIVEEGATDPGGSSDTISLQITTTASGGDTGDGPETLTNQGTLTVQSTNATPTASDDSTTTEEDTPVVITVLDTDSDPDGDPLAITGVSDPPNGSAAINSDGTITYTPDADFVGTDSFSYTISDGAGGTDTATVTVTVTAVTPVNEAPTAINLSDDTVSESLGVGSVIGTLSAVDPDAGDTETYSIIDNPDSKFTIINGNQLQLTATLDFETQTSHSVTVRVTDSGGLSVDQIFIITVTDFNDRPVAGDDIVITNIVDGSDITISAAALLANDSDADGDPLDISAAAGTAGGTAAVVSGDVVFTPSSTSFTAGTFDYTVDDGGGGTDTASVTITGVAGATITGTVADEILLAGDGNDTLIGNAGNDILIGGTGNDTIDAGDGDDTILYALGDGSDTVDGGAGSDTFIATGTSGGNSFSITGSSGDPNLAFGAGGATSSVTNVEDIVVDAGDGNDTVVVSGDLSASGVSQNTVTIIGGAGDDLLDASGVTSGTRVVLSGLDGNDTLIGSSGADDLLGGAGDDTLIGDGGGEGDGVTAAAADTFAVTASDDGEALVNAILGSGITIVGPVTYTGSATSSGVFEGGLVAGIGIESGIILTSGDATDAVGPNDSDSTTTSTGTGGDADLNALIPQITNDVSSLEFTFLSDGGDLFFNFVFASEEYNEFANTSFNDVFAFFLDGENVALIPGTDTPVSINNVNGGNPFGTNAVNPDLFNNNDPSDGGPFFNIEYDGFTDVFTVTVIGLEVGEHTMKIAIADAGDSSFDSAVFIEAGSFSDQPAGNDTLTGGTGADTFVFDFGNGFGNDTITDFLDAEDILSFDGVDAVGGKVDVAALNTLIASVDNKKNFDLDGENDDVRVNFTDGSSIVFEDLNTGLLGGDFTDFNVLSNILVNS